MINTPPLTKTPITNIILPDLEDRFLPDNNWNVGSFTNPETNHEIHYSTSLIKSAKNTLIILPGLSEFGEKYIETTKFFNNQNYDVYIIDWAYQGRSSRYKANHNKRYSDGYEADLSDLNFFIKNIIKPNKPLYMLGHSMGAHIAMRYLATQDHNIKAASFSAPMLSIKGLKYFPAWLSFIFKPFENSYVPKGKDWSTSSRSNGGADEFSSDSIRGQIHSTWSIFNPELRVGNATLKWVITSLKSMKILNSSKSLKKITIPTLFGIAENDLLINNHAIFRAINIIPNAKTVEFKNAKHEILVETDDIRGVFLNKTLKLFKQ
jgi:lysophospholipase